LVESKLIQHFRGEIQVYPNSCWLISHFNGPIPAANPVANPGANLGLANGSPAMSSSMLFGLERLQTNHTFWISK
jgi:hypothetical protein